MIMITKTDHYDHKCSDAHENENHNDHDEVHNDTHPWESDDDPHRCYKNDSSDTVCPS